jgi:hypothetical protein
MKSITEIICEKFYNKNKNNQKLLSPEVITTKSNGFFNIWSGSSHFQLVGSYPYFGFKSGIYIKYHYMTFLTGRGDDDYFEIDLEKSYEIEELIFSENKISFENWRGLKFIKCDNEEVNLVKEFIDFYLSEKKSIENDEKEKQRNILEENSKIEVERIRLLNSNKLELINELDKDGNKEVDLVDGESFNKLLTKNQKSIIEIDKNYIQKFVKISIYLKTKKSNTQKIFDSIKETKNDTELNELVNLLKNQIHTYDLLVFHSISMITSLVESDLITFYEIYECFDQLGVFNSTWENDVSKKLIDIGDGIKDLMYSIYQMENKIVNSIDNLTYVTQDSFKELNMSVNNQLSGINSSIKFNNLLTGIQTYQMYKINQNTKRIG